MKKIPKKAGLIPNQGLAFKLLIPVGLVLFASIFIETGNSRIGKTDWNLTTWTQPNTGKFRFILKVDDS